MSNKSRPFSIYLLKEAYSATNALEEDHGLIEVTDAIKLPPNASLFLKDDDSMPPWWKSYFGINNLRNQTLKGSILFIPVADRCFVLTFGHVRHNLKDASYEYDFGLKVTLNCVDKNKLKQTKTIEPGPARQRQTQIPVAQGLTYFDFDKDTNIIKSLTGKVKEEYKDWFKNASGATSLRVSLKIEPNELPVLCENLLERYNSGDYETTFPDINSIDTRIDPETLGNLEGKLLEALKGKDENLQFSVPDIDYDSSVGFSFTSGKKATTYEDAYIGHYYEHLEENGIDLNSLSIEEIKKQKLYVRDEDGGFIKDKQSIYKSLIFDVTLEDQGNEIYHLCLGQWYRINTNFIEKMNTYLDQEQFNIELGFQDFRHKNEKGNFSEAVYNEALAEADNNLICLDTKNIAPDGETAVEPCDLYKVESGGCVFVHVKRSTLSSHLSHLFNQGINSAKLLIMEKNSQDKFKALIGDEYDEVYKTAIDNPNKYKVVYAIISRKPSQNRSENLPLFSRISLMRTLKDLQISQVSAAYGFINDASKDLEE